MIILPFGRLIYRETSKLTRSALRFANIWSIPIMLSLSLTRVSLRSTRICWSSSVLISSNFSWMSCSQNMMLNRQVPRRKDHQHCPPWPAKEIQTCSLLFELVKKLFHDLSWQNFFLLCSSSNNWSRHTTPMLRFMPKRTTLLSNIKNIYKVHLV